MFVVSKLPLVFGTTDEPGVNGPEPFHLNTLTVAVPPPPVKSAKTRISPCACAGAKSPPGLGDVKSVLGAVPFRKNQKPICASPLLEVLSPAKYKIPFVKTAAALAISFLALVCPITQLKYPEPVPSAKKKSFEAVNWLSTWPVPNASST